MLPEPTMPECRRRLLQPVAAHAQSLTVGFDQIAELHRERSRPLVDWIVEHYQAGRALPIIVICTGNSRRSILGSTLGNVAAVYYGLPEIEFFSGGTEPSAFNRRTIAALREIGVQIEPTGNLAKPGAGGEANAIYQVRWGTVTDGRPLQTLEFSKRYDDAHNPQSGFAAILVCSEADAACPAVPGASCRIPLPFVDPKSSDDTAAESQTYASRRDEIGRVLMAALLQARLRLTSAGKL
jgi:arsenate reductase (thioredoxin)